MYVGETGRSVGTRKREHADAVKTFNTKKSALSQHVMDFDHRIDWDNVKILKSELHAYRQRRSSRPPNPPIGGGPGQLWGPKLV